nr:MazG-like family protein [Streptomyces sp. SID4917]
MERLAATQPGPVPEDGAHGPDLWQTIHGLVAWIDTNNGRDQHEIAMRILKVTEEAGEVASAYIGMTGQNPRKGVTHTITDVQGELCDVMLTAAVALASISDDPGSMFDAKLARVAERAAAVEAQR